MNFFRASLPSAADSLVDLDFLGNLEYLFDLFDGLLVDFWLTLCLCLLKGFLLLFFLTFFLFSWASLGFLEVEYFTVFFSWLPLLPTHLPLMQILFDPQDEP